jgi:hypothetical protein
VIIECYVFMPYEGQLRFSYDTETNQIGKSNPTADAPLGVFKLTGQRPPTCKEFIYSGKHHFDDNIRLIILRWIIPRLANEVQVELGDELLGAFPFSQGFKFTARRVAQ